MTMLAVFRSRSQSIEFASALKREGVPAQSVSTPKDAGVGCGISVRFEENFFPRVKSVLQKKLYSSFSGFMRGEGGRFRYLSAK